MHLRTDTSANSYFSRVPTISHSRNAFSVAEKHVTTMQFDYLIPVAWKYMYPGDTLSVDLRMMMRLSTQATTLYDDLYFDVHAWFVPFRLLQTNWARYQFNAQPSGPTQDNSALTSPKITLSGLGAGGFVAKSLYDYLGFPTEVNLSADTEHINNYLGRAYNFIWNLNYRDQNLQNAVTVDLDDGPDDPANYVLLKRGKRHDKFTSALTAQQKGTAPTLPLGTTAPVWGSATAAAAAFSQDKSPIISAWIDRATTDGVITGPFSSNAPGSAVPPNPMPVGIAGTTGGTANTPASPTPGNIVFLNETLSKAFRASAEAPFYADLASATSASLQQIRQSFAVQHLLEADARGGTRDVESIQHRWGVTVPDFRLQRPEYLGGQTFTFDGIIVPQSSETGTTPQGNLTQFSQAMNSFGIVHSFVEHGVFMVLISARSNITYQQGLLRELSYRTRYDWYHPEFANLGEVSILNKEIYMAGVSADNETFGFGEYGYELRFNENRVTAEMRSNYATSRDSKHMADEYGSLPTLGAAWIQSNTEISRNLVVSAATADPIEMNSYMTGRIVRTLPMYSIPGLLRL